MFRMDLFLEAAIDEARQGMQEGGIPIGSVIVHSGTIIGRRPQPACPAGERDPARRDGRL